MTEIVEVKRLYPSLHRCSTKTAGAAHKPPGKTDRDNPQRDHIPREHPSVFLTGRSGNCGNADCGIYHSPTGGKAWIEDVVMDEKYRGQGFSKQLVTHAVRFVKEQGIPLIMLTSNPTRIAANKLYQKLGFEQKQTNVYRMNLE